MTQKVTAKQIAAALYSHFVGRWAVLTEVSARPAPTGVGQPRDPDNRMRRIDVLLVRAFPGRGQRGVERLAIEVKVTRGDFLSDVRNPAKQAPWRELAHRHAYAVPEGLVGEREVPANSGLLVVGPRSGVSWARRAARPAGHDPGDLPMPNLMDAFWRAGRAEAQLKGLARIARGVDQDDAEALRAQVARLTRENGLLADQVHRAREQTERWKHAFGAVGAPPCGTCGAPLHLTRRGGYSTSWEHRDPVDAAGCELLRRTEAERRDSERPANERMGSYLYVPQPEPAELDVVAGTEPVDHRKTIASV